MQPGDLLVLYTDGITEAEGSSGVLYGLDRLIQSAVNTHLLGAEHAAAAIIADLKAHIGMHRVHDDITLVVVKHR